MKMELQKYMRGGLLILSRRELLSLCDVVLVVILMIGSQQESDMAWWPARGLGGGVA